MKIFLRDGKIVYLYRKTLKRYHFYRGYLRGKTIIYMSKIPFEEVLKLIKSLNIDIQTNLKWK